PGFYHRVGVRSAAEVWPAGFRAATGRICALRARDLAGWRLSFEPGEYQVVQGARPGFPVGCGVDLTQACQGEDDVVWGKCGAYSVALAAPAGWAVALSDTSPGPVNGASATASIASRFWAASERRLRVAPATSGLRLARRGVPRLLWASPLKTFPGIISCRGV